MTRKQSAAAMAAVAELYGRELAVPATDHEPTRGENRPAMDDGHVIAHPADGPRPTLAA